MKRKKIKKKKVPGRDLLQSKVPFLERLPERIYVHGLLLLGLRTLLPHHPLLQPKQLGQDPPPKLQVEPRVPIERHDERLALHHVVPLILRPQPDAKVVPVLRLLLERGKLLGHKGRVLHVVRLDAECGLGETALHEVRGHGDELPYKVHVAVAADFVGDGAESSLGFGGEHGLERVAEAYHLAVRLGGFAVDVGEVALAGGGGRVWEGHDYEVAWEADAVRGKRRGHGKWPLGGGDVGVLADAAAHVRGEVGVGEAEEALVGPGRWELLMTMALLAPTVAGAVVVVAAIAAVRARRFIVAVVVRSLLVSCR